MATINLKDGEISCKIVYYGPSLSGKTTNICFIHENAPQESKSNLQCVDTRGDRTLFFDHFALDLGQVGSMRTRFQIYGVPGQAQYRLTRKMVLSGVDGIVFVADSEVDRYDDNIAGLDDMRSLLEEHNYDFETIPMIMQYNKRDLPEKIPLNELQERLNIREAPWFEAIATKGDGVIESFKAYLRGSDHQIEQKPEFKTGITAEISE